jgi:hypothetical protein
MASNVDVSFEPDEANAVLCILEIQAGGLPIPESDWQTLFDSEGYIRLKEREASIGRSFEDDGFKSFITSPDLLARRNDLKQTLQTWQQINLDNVLSRTLAYLPVETSFRAKIYPVIKPKTNSFVFDLENNPAIFLYLDPDIQLDQLENTLVHELLHIGLAAAGSPDIHPHVSSKPEDREHWDESMQKFEADFREVEAFLIDVADGKLSGQPMLEAGFRFFGIQGPWYTIGWKMAVTIEREFDRDAVIEAFCDPHKLLVVYNQSAAPNQPLWNQRLIQLAR